jgi:hypothetical protein
VHKHPYPRLLNLKAVLLQLQTLPVLLAVAALVVFATPQGSAKAPHPAYLRAQSAGRLQLEDPHFASTIEMRPAPQCAERLRLDRFLGPFPLPHLGLSRLARFASAKGIEPAQVDDAVIEAFITAVRSGTLHRKPNELHRKVAQIWNEAVERSGLDLQAVRVPSFQSPAKRLDWTLLGRAFRKDADRFLTGGAGTDVFAANARPRPLAPRTVKLRRDQIHAAVTALVESGVKMSTIKSLAVLVTPENFKRILRRRHEMVGGRENIFNHDLAVSLLQIAREWVKVDAGVLAELRRLARKVPTPPSGLTDKNKRVLRQFDDPAVLRRLYKFSTSAWAEVKRDSEPNRQTLVKAQRGATSTLEFAASEVKNRRELAFDIPPHLTKMLIEYRNRIAPKVIGRRPDKLFVKADGNPKNQWAVAWLIRTYLRKPQ